MSLRTLLQSTVLLTALGLSSQDLHIPQEWVIGTFSVLAAHYVPSLLALATQV